MEAWSNWLMAALRRMTKRSGDSFVMAFCSSSARNAAASGAYFWQSSAMSWPSPYFCNTRSASFSRARSRVLSSAVAALVKVTTRILSTGICSSSTSRANRAAMFQVLPVPALASIRLMP